MNHFFWQFFFSPFRSKKCYSDAKEAHFNSIVQFINFNGWIFFSSLCVLFSKEEKNTHRNETRCNFTSVVHKTDRITVVAIVCWVNMIRWVFVYTKSKIAIFLWPNKAKGEIIQVFFLFLPHSCNFVREKMWCGLREKKRQLLAHKAIKKSWRVRCCSWLSFYIINNLLTSKYATQQQKAKNLLVNSLSYCWIFIEVRSVNSF